MSPLIYIAVCWIAASYVIGVALTAEQLRRPEWEWEAAGSDRRFWVWLTVVLGFHGLGQYAAVAYLVGVRPRLQAAQRSRPPSRLDALNSGLARQWHRGTDERVAARWRRRALSRPKSAADELVVLAVLLVLASSLVHAAVISVHFEDYWPFGICFAVATVLQALWSARVYSEALSRRLLIAGAVGNGALVAAWLISRTVGLPLGPQPWEPEAVGAVDVLVTLNELLAIGLIAAALACMRDRRPSISPVYLRLATAFTGVLFLYSVLLPFAGDHSA